MEKELVSAQTCSACHQVIRSTKTKEEKQFGFALFEYKCDIFKGGQGTRASTIRQEIGSTFTGRLLQRVHNASSRVLLNEYKLLVNQSLQELVQTSPHTGKNGFRAARVQPLSLRELWVVSEYALSKKFEKHTREHFIRGSNGHKIVHYYIHTGDLSGLYWQTVSVLNQVASKALAWWTNLANVCRVADLVRRTICMSTKY